MAVVLWCVCIIVNKQVCMMYACKHVYLLFCESGDKLKASGDGGESIKQSGKDD